MSTITTIAAGDQVTNSRSVINTNFSNLNTDKIETSVIDTDAALAANSDAKIPSQKAVKAYVDAGGALNASTTVKGVVEEATQAEVAAGTAAGGTSARLFINPSSTTSKIPNTSAFSASSPTSYTDLDLSSIVGARSCVVLLKVKNSGATNVTYYFRKNGDTDTINGTGEANGVSHTDIVATGGTFAYVICITDSSGIVEWYSDDGGVGTATTTSVTVEAYW
jgi:hypothetical protein